MMTSPKLKRAYKHKNNNNNSAFQVLLILMEVFAQKMLTLTLSQQPFLAFVFRLGF